MKTYYATFGHNNVHAFHGADARNAWVEKMSKDFQRWGNGFNPYHAIGSAEAREMASYVSYIVLHSPQDDNLPWYPAIDDMREYPKWLGNLIADFDLGDALGYLPENGGYTFARDQRHPY